MAGGIEVDNYRQPLIELKYEKLWMISMIMTGGCGVDSYGQPLSNQLKCY